MYKTLTKEEIVSGMVVVSNNGWYGDSRRQIEQHRAITNLRAIEHRKPLVHVIVNGPSYIVDPVGRYVFEAPHMKRGGWVTRFYYDETPDYTFFSKHPYLIKGILTLFFLIMVGRKSLFLKKL